MLNSVWKERRTIIGNWQVSMHTRVILQLSPACAALNNNHHQPTTNNLQPFMHSSLSPTTIPLLSPPTFSSQSLHLSDIPDLSLLFALSYHPRNSSPSALSLVSLSACSHAGLLRDRPFTSSSHASFSGHCDAFCRRKNTLLLFPLSKKKRIMCCPL